MVKEATIEYRPNGADGGLSVLHFADTATNTTILAVLNSFANGVRVHMPDVVGVRPGEQVRTLNTATGQMEGISSVGTVTEVFGSIAGGEMLPQNVSLQIDWLTTGVVNGRVVRGRVFVPFIDQSANVDGHPSATLAVSMILTDRRVWARPLYAPGVDGAPPTLLRAGSLHSITGVNTRNSEWATQGSRRRA